MSLKEMLSLYSEITLNEMNSVALMNRHDTKHLICGKNLESLLETLHQHYKVLSIGNTTVLPYKTLYYDTPDMFCYLQHHNQRSHRYKFRSREYLSTGVVFNEIKEKRNTGKTYKTRIARDSFSKEIDNVFLRFIEKKTGKSPNLLPKLHVYYRRITLVNSSFPERLTIDTDLTFANENDAWTLPDTIIVERKSEKNGMHSEAKKILTQLRSNPTGFSKYCIGTAILSPEIKQNNFKQKIRKITVKERITHDRIPGSIWG